MLCGIIKKIIQTKVNGSSISILIFGNNRSIKNECFEKIDKTNNKIAFSLDEIMLSLFHYNLGYDRNKMIYEQLKNIYIQAQWKSSELT